MQAAGAAGVRRHRTGNPDWWEGTAFPRLSGVGFVLTTVLGGALGYDFQTRAWRHQHHTELREEQRRQAMRVFEELSTLMDRRIYRMRQVVWAGRGAAESGEVTQDLRDARHAYRAVVDDWNDNLNRSLALA